MSTQTGQPPGQVQAYFAQGLNGDYSPNQAEMKETEWGNHMLVSSIPKRKMSRVQKTGKETEVMDVTNGVRFQHV